MSSSSLWRDDGQQSDYGYRWRYYDRHDDDEERERRDKDRAQYYAQRANEPRPPSAPWFGWRFPEGWTKAQAAHAFAPAYDLVTSPANGRLYAFVKIDTEEWRYGGCHVAQGMPVAEYHSTDPAAVSPMRLVAGDSLTLWGC